MKFEVLRLAGSLAVAGAVMLTADLVQRRPARRQPGADRADGRRRKRACSRAGEDRLQGDRGRLPAASQTDFEFVPRAHREKPDPRRRHHPGADAGAARADRAHLRVVGRQARDRPSLQLDLHAAAPRRVRPRPRRHHDIAVQGAKLVKQKPRSIPETEWVFEYSPESFTGTELDFARRGLRCGDDVWQPTPAQKMILNLPATVEMATPNVYADQIEWCHRNSHAAIHHLSLHPHNDRGTAVAAAELGDDGRRRPRRRHACSATASAPATSTSSRWR
jgi:hypothetical protein